MTTSSSKPPRSGPQGGPAPRAPSSYSRFIPREELGAFAAWSPDTLNAEFEPGGQAPAAAPAAGPAGAGNGAGTDKALQAQVAAARQAGYQDGYRDGLVALDSFKQSFATQMAAQFGPLLKSFEQQLGALEQQMAQAVAQAALLLARRVVRAELHAHPAQVAEVAAQAVQAVLQSAGQLRVLVHPEDHALVAAGAAEALQARGARLLASPDIERGGCIVESDLGCIDARIEARWRQAAAVLGGELPWDDTAPAAAADGGAR